MLSDYNEIVEIIIEKQLENPKYLKIKEHTSK